MFLELSDLTVSPIFPPPYVVPLLVEYPGQESRGFRFHARRALFGGQEGQMAQSLTSSVVLLLVTVSPLAVLGIITWQWQKEINEATRLRRAATLHVRK
jgi:hypothetical protein